MESCGAKATGRRAAILEDESVVRYLVLATSDRSSKESCQTAVSVVVGKQQSSI